MEADLSPPEARENEAAGVVRNETQTERQPRFPLRWLIRECWVWVVGECGP